MPISQQPVSKLMIQEQNKRKVTQSTYELVEISKVKQYR